MSQSVGIDQLISADLSRHWIRANTEGGLSLVEKPQGFFGGSLHGYDLGVSLT